MAPPADEWFWPEVVTGWRAEASRAERWSLLLQAAHGVPGAAIVAAAVIDRAIRAGVEDALLSSVPTGQGARWLRLEGWTSLSPDAAPPMWRPPSPLLREVMRRWRGTWGPDDDRLIWLTTLLTVLEHPACAADHRLPGRVAFALRTVLGLGAQQGVSSQQQGQQPGAILPGQDAIGIVTRAGLTVEGDEEREASEVAGSLRSGPRPGGVDSRPRVDSADPSWPAPTADRTFERLPRRRAPCGTPAGARAAALRGGSVRTCGRCVHVLRRPALRRADPRAARVFDLPCLTPGVSRPAVFPTRLLWFIGQRVGLPPDDPLALSFRAELAGEDDPAPFGTADVTFTLPARAAEILSAPEPRAPLDSPCTAWLTAVRRWSQAPRTNGTDDADSPSGARPHFKDAHRRRLRLVSNRCAPAAIWRSTWIPAGCRGWVASCNSTTANVMTEGESAPAPAVRLQDVALAAVEEICAARARRHLAKQEDHFLHHTAGVVRANGRSLNQALDECVRAPAPEDERLVWLASQLHLSHVELLAVALAAAVEDNPIVGRVLAHVQTPVGGSRPTLGLLASSLERAFDTNAAVMPTLLNGPAVKSGLLCVLNDAAPLPERPVMVPAPLCLAIAGHDSQWAGTTIGMEHATTVPLPDSVRARAQQHAAALEGESPPRARRAHRFTGGGSQRGARPSPAP